MGGSSKQVTTSQTQPYAPAIPAIDTVLTNATNFYNAGVGAGVYDGKRVADYNGNETDALNNIANDARNGVSSTTQAGLDYVKNQLGTNTINPFLEQQIAGSQNDAANQIASRFSGAGRYGSGAAQTAIAQKVAQVGNDARSGAYEAQQNRNVGLLGQLGNLEQLRQQPNQNLLQVGQLQQAHSQAEIDAARQKFAEEQAAPRDALNNYAQLAYTAGGLGSQGTSTTKSSANPVQQAIGIGTSLLGGLGKSGGLSSIFGGGGQSVGAAASGLGSLSSLAALFSDERLKKNIKKVGKLDNGLPVYSYGMKSGGPMQIGLLAQDVEKKMPDAVMTDPASGYKKVNYGMASRRRAA